VLGNAAVHRVTEDDAGLASGIQQALQHIGGPSASRAGHPGAAGREDAVAPRTDPLVAITGGYVLALQVGTVLLAAAAVLAAVLLHRGTGRGAAPVAVAH
jgi:hypothetical protein